MLEHVRNSTARRILYSAFWISSICLFVGVEIISVLIIHKARTLQVEPRYSLSYFVPVLLGLPFLVGVQAHRYMHKSQSLRGLDRTVLASLSTFVLWILIWSYVGFARILGSLLDVLLSMGPTASH